MPEPVDLSDELADIADALLAEAAIASRTGQLDRLTVLSQRIVAASTALLAEPEHTPGCHSHRGVDLTWPCTCRPERDRLSEAPTLTEGRLREALGVARAALVAQTRAGSYISQGMAKDALTHLDRLSGSGEQDDG